MSLIYVYKGVYYVTESQEEFANGKWRKKGKTLQEVGTFHH